MDSRKLALLCRELADNKKAEDIVILDVREAVVGHGLLRHRGRHERAAPAGDCG